MLTGGGVGTRNGLVPTLFCCLFGSPPPENADRQVQSVGSSCNKAVKPPHSRVPCGHAIHSVSRTMPIRLTCLILHGSCRHVNIADMTTNARSETGSESHTGYATGLFRSCLHALKLNGSMTGRTPVDMLASQANRVPAENRRISICRYRSGDGSYPRWLISIHV